MEGGSFGVKLLEHWHHNLKHGLFEGFDEFGNKTFMMNTSKDLESSTGLSIKPKLTLVLKGDSNPHASALDP